MIYLQTEKKLLAILIVSLLNGHHKMIDRSARYMLDRCVGLYINASTSSHARLADQYHIVQSFRALGTTSGHAMDDRKLNASLGACVYIRQLTRRSEALTPCRLRPAGTRPLIDVNRNSTYRVAYYFRGPTDRKRRRAKRRKVVGVSIRRFSKKSVCVGGGGGKFARFSPMFRTRQLKR